MRGYPNFNFQEFDNGYAYLKWLGHDVVSPHKLDVANGFVKIEAYWFENDHGIWQYEYDKVELTHRFSIEAAMRIDVAAILEVDAITFLPEWQKSDGARNEFAVARMLGLPVYEHEPWKMFHEVVPAVVGVA